METILQIPAMVTKIVTMRDKTLRLQLDTNEIPAEQKSLVFALHEKYGWFMFSELKQEKLPDIPDYKPEFADEKTPSKRLRAVLFVLWQQTKSPLDFEIFYKQRIDRIIEQVKEKLV